MSFWDSHVFDNMQILPENRLFKGFQQPIIYQTLIGAWPVSKWPANNILSVHEENKSILFVTNRKLSKLSIVSINKYKVKVSKQ